MSKRVREFQHFCQAIAEDQPQSTKALNGLGQIVERDMPEQYRMPYAAPAVTDLTEAQNAKHLRGLWYEYVQHLTDLGYLSEAEYQAFHLREKNLSNRYAYLEPVIDATRLYVQEELKLGWGILLNILPLDHSVSMFWTEQHLSTLTDRIGRYTAFDGSLPAPKRYTTGSKSCYGRAMAYRLRSLFASQVNVKNELFFSKEMVGYVASLANQLQGKKLKDRKAFDQLIEGIKNGENLPAWIWDLTGNIDLLFTAFTKREGAEDRKNRFWVFYVADSESGEWRTPKITDWTDITRKPARRMAKQIDISAAGNPLGIRLLQIKLWQASFYVGAIDGDWGKMSHKGLVNLLEREHEIGQEAGLGKLKLKRIAKALLKHKAKVTTFMVDLRVAFRLLDNYFRSADDKKVVTGDETDVNEDLDLYRIIKEEGALQSDVQIDNRILEEQLDEDKEFYSNPNEHPRRRVAFPRKSFIRGLFHGIKKIVAWIKTRIKKLLGPVFGFVKYILQRVRRGIQLFFTGFKYLSYFVLGKPLVTTVYAEKEPNIPLPLVTKFSLDFDALNFVPTGTTRKDVKRHSRTIRLMKDSMFFFVDVIVWVIKAIGKLSSPGGWVWLGLQLLKGLKGALFRFIGGDRVEAVLV